MISNEIILRELWEFLERHFGGQVGKSVLDLGAGEKPYAPLYSQYFGSCTSTDVPYSRHDVRSVDVMASADALPFEAGSFDCVICTEVLEHCARPFDVVGEISRVLRPGGWLFVTTPFLRPLHEMPHDYYRYTPSALREFGNAAGLTVSFIRPRGDYVAVLLAVLLMPVGKAWYVLRKLTGLPLDRPRNPLLYITLMLPQYAYLWGWRRVRRGPGVGARAYRKLSYYTLGYITEMQKV
jgi:SAM-dependent methyltransferase